MSSTRIAVGIEYDGSRFCGWQMQAHGTRTVQDELQKALGLEVRLAHDANWFALAEARLGAGRGAETVVGASGDADSVRLPTMPTK